MIGRTLAHYEILERIGAGGMGEVYRARDTRLHRDVALKILPSDPAGESERLARFQQEARAVAALRHPGIVTIHSVEEHGGQPFLTMELVPGRTLTDLIAGGFTRKEFLSIAGQIADAVSAAHALGIVHRDLKPDNILVDPEGRVKVLDFGLARLGLDVAESTVLATEAGRVLGTAPYMSPEQVQGKPVEAAGDVFSLGIVFHEMLAGRRPFTGETFGELAASILRDEPPRCPGSADLAALVHRCLEKHPAQRFPSAIELRDESRRLTGSATGGASAVPSIAVLPFADLSPEKDQEYFCDGMAEEILDSLTRIRGLRVTPRISAFAFRNSETDSRAVGERLGVATLLQGSVRKAGDRLRITTQLIQVADDRCVWSERYDRRMRDVFAIQEDIAQSIVQSLRGALRPEEAAVLPRTATSHVAAYDHYLRGRSHFYKGSRKDHELAQRMFSRAIEIDPEFSRAHAGLADSLAYTYKHFERSDKILAEADVASARALELDPDSAEAHAARGVVHWMRERHADADREFETAIRLDPRLFEAYFHFALSCFNRGMPKRSVELLERAEEIRPEDYQPPLIAATLHQGLGRKEKAEAAFRRGLAMVERHLDLVPDDVRALYLGAQALVFLGETERGLEWADRARDMDPDNSLVLLNVAEARSLAGRADEALDALERAIDLGYGHRGTLLHDPCLAPIRNHPRFRRLVDRMT